MALDGSWEMPFQANSRLAEFGPAFEAGLQESVSVFQCERRRSEVPRPPFVRPSGKGEQ